MPGKVFLDTNVLVYAHDTQDERKRDAARAVIWNAVRGANGVVSAQVLSEFFVTITQKVARPMAVDLARSEVALFSTLEVVDIDPTLVLGAIDMRSRWQVSFWDGLILSAAARAECRTIYSEDLSDGQVYGELTVRNPFKAADA